MPEHWSSPNGCAPGCPACREERDENSLGDCCNTLCEWEADTTRDGKPYCHGCAEAFDAGVAFANRTKA